jgi:hypothetical protein
MRRFLLTTITLLILCQSAFATDHRYWRVIANDVSWNTTIGTYELSASEIQFYAAGVNICIGKTASASSSFAPQPFTNANDGSFATYSYSIPGNDSTPEWWGIDAVTPVTVTGVIIYPNYSTDAFLPKSINLQYCDTPWTCTTAVSFITVNANIPTYWGTAAPVVATGNNLFFGSMF